MELSSMYASKHDFHLTGIQKMNKLLLSLLTGSFGSDIIFFGQLPGNAHCIMSLTFSFVVWRPNNTLSNVFKY